MDPSHPSAAERHFIALDEAALARRGPDRQGPAILLIMVAAIVVAFANGAGVLVALAVASIVPLAGLRLLLNEVYWHGTFHQNPSGHAAYKAYDKARKQREQEALLAEWKGLSA